ncbi:hypothetical protein TNCV_736371 [Trichonephila clavipes]|nr:hypothetical protein TNCV_736371 [Trichonephila clavipes]
MWTFVGKNLPTSSRLIGSESRAFRLGFTNESVPLEEDASSGVVFATLLWLKMTRSVAKSPRVSKPCEQDREGRHTNLLFLAIDHSTANEGRNRIYGEKSRELNLPPRLPCSTLNRVRRDVSCG